MYQIGQLKDVSAIANIKKHYNKYSIEFNIENINGVYLIFIYKEDDIELATEYFRLALGLPPIRTLPPEWESIKAIKIGGITKTLIGVCILIFILKKISPQLYQSFYFALDFGRPWLLITPIFLHFNIFHILFNMLWLKDLGKSIEYHKGKVFFVNFILLTGIVSNFAQYYVVGPNFGGMSGVVFAFVGYMWINKEFNDTQDMALPKSDIIMMVAWFIICAFGVIPNIANAAHGVGLFLGMLIALIEISIFTKNIKSRLKLYVVYPSIALTILFVTFLLEYL